MPLQGEEGRKEGRKEGAFCHEKKHQLSYDIICTVQYRTVQYFGWFDGIDPIRQAKTRQK